MIAIQLVSAQIGRVTGKGIIANVKDFGPRWLVVSLVSILVIANTFNIAADLAAMGGALSLVIGGLNREHALIFAATAMSSPKVKLNKSPVAIAPGRSTRRLTSVTCQSCQSNYAAIGMQRKFTCARLYCWLSSR